MPTRKRVLTPEQKIARAVYYRNWKVKNKDKVLAWSRQWYARLDEAGRALYRARHRKHKGRPLPDPTKPETTICEICGKPPTWGSMNLDHSHVTGKFRGWLCGNCNRGLGFFKDNPALLRKAAEYLEK